MDPGEFRRHGHALVEWIADYLEGSERYPVLPRVAPGEVIAALPRQAPERGEPFEAIFADFERVLVPALTHWNHPGFFGYFAITASAPGVLAEFLSAALNQQAMLWRTSPAATELEEVALNWLRDLIGLPAGFEGVIYDTASIATPACARGRPRTGGTRRARAGTCRAIGSWRLSRVLLRARAFVGGQGHDRARTRACLASPHRGRRRVQDATGGVAPGGCGRPRQRPHADRGGRDDRNDVDHQRRSGARDRGLLRRARTSGCTSMPRMLA